LLLGLAPADVPRLGEVGIDGRVLAVTLAASLVVGVTFGLVPTLQAARVDAMLVVRGEGTVGSARARRFRQGLVVFELGMAVMLVVSAGLLIRSFQSVLRVDPGFRAEGVLKAEFRLPTTRYPRDFDRWPEWTEVHGFQATLLARVEAIPGVEAVALAGQHPLDAGFTNSFRIVGREAEGADWPEISTRMVSPAYFAVMGVRVLDGRSFTAADDARAPLVALINENAVRRFFPNASPIGHEIRFWGIGRRIIGVVADERIQGVTAAAPPAVYMALAQAPARSGATVLLARVAGNPVGLAPPITRAITELDPQLAVYGVERFSETLISSVGEHRFTMLVLSAFAGVTLLLALIGVHGVVSYATSQRTHELGIRAALGATQPRIARLVLKGGVGLAIAGTVAGIGGAVLGSNLLAGLLYGVGRLDLVTFVTVPLLVVLAAVLATWLPARRAARVAPMEALRVE
jgi:predicted permease